MVLSYTIYEDYPVITRNVRFEQKGAQKIVLERAMSASVEFLDMDYELVQLSGAWSREPVSYTHLFSSGMINQIFTTYEFGKVFAVTEGIWDISSALPFEASFHACFCLLYTSSAARVDMCPDLTMHWKMQT